MNKEQQLSYVSNILAQAMYYGLESEVVLDALELVKENPDMDPINALELAAKDWDVYVDQKRHD